MVWLVWGILGYGLGWWATVLFGKSNQAEEETPTAPSLSDVWLLAYAIYDCLLYLVFAVLFVAIFLLAAAHYFQWLPPKAYSFEGFVLSKRAVAIMAGFGLGVFRKGIAAQLSRFYDAILGTDKQSSWALQSAAAILLLLGIVLALNPALLGHLESFKAGEVEAKFSSISSATRETVRLGLPDYFRHVTFNQWIGFKRNYRRGPRNDVLELDRSSIRGFRREIRDRLFERYIEPLMILLDCLDNDNRIDRIRSDETFRAMVIGVRNRILYEAEDGSGQFFTEKEWREILKSIDEQIKKANMIVKSEIPGEIREKKCPDLASLDLTRNCLKQEQLDAKKLGVRVTDAAILRDSSKEKKYKLSFLDPYLIAAVADLVALTLGFDEKASFLVRVKSGYPDTTETTELIQPGLVNFYYQITDGILKSEAMLPLDETIAELNKANDGVDFIVNEMRKKSRTTSPNSEKSTPNYDPMAVIELYAPLKLIIANQYMEIYIQRALGGDPLTEPHRNKWIMAYRYAQNVLAVRGPGVILDLNWVGTLPLSADDETTWEKVFDGVKKSIIFDARFGLALSSILLTEEGGSAPAQACAIAHFYLAAADDSVGDVGLPKPDGISRLKAYLLQARTRVDASCGATL